MMQNISCLYAFSFSFFLLFMSSWWKSIWNRWSNIRPWCFTALTIAVFWSIGTWRHPKQLSNLNHIISDGFWKKYSVWIKIADSKLVLSAIVILIEISRKRISLNIRKWFSTKMDGSNEFKFFQVNISIEYYHLFEKKNW